MITSSISRSASLISWLTAKPTRRCMPCIVNGSGLAHNDSRFILVHAKCLHPVGGRSVVLLEPRCSREFGKLQAFEWEIALVVSDQISYFCPTGDPPFYSPRGVSITGYLKVEERCVRESVPRSADRVPQLCRGCQPYQTKLSGDHRPSPPSWSGRLVLFLCAEPSPGWGRARVDEYGTAVTLRP
jgi:hypothetical protein